MKGCVWGNLEIEEDALENIDYSKTKTKKRLEHARKLFGK